MNSEIRNIYNIIEKQSNLISALEQRLLTNEQYLSIIMDNNASNNQMMTLNYQKLVTSNSSNINTISNNLIEQVNQINYEHSISLKGQFAASLENSLELKSINKRIDDLQVFYNTNIADKSVPITDSQVRVEDTHPVIDIPAIDVSIVGTQIPIEQQ